MVLWKATALQAAEKVGFVSGHRFSDAASRALSIAPLGAEVTISTFSAVPPKAAKNAGFVDCCFLLRQSIAPEGSPRSLPEPLLPQF